METPYHLSFSCVKGKGKWCRPLVFSFLVARTIVEVPLIWYTMTLMSLIKLHRYDTALLMYLNTSLRWRHNGRDSVSNHQPHDGFLNRLFRRRSKKTSKLRVTGLCARNSPGTGEFPAQMASNAENVSIWWRHHGNTHVPYLTGMDWTDVYTHFYHVNDILN